MKITQRDRGLFQAARDAARDQFQLVKITGQVVSKEAGGLWLAAEVFVPNAMLERDTAAKARQIIETIAGMAPYSIDASDDKIEDAFATMNRLILDARMLMLSPL